MYTFKIYDLSATLHWELRYTSTSEPQFVTVFGSSHVWLWDFVSGSLLKDGDTNLIDGGWSIVIEKADV